MFLNLDFERSNHLSGLSYNIHNKELISVKKNEDKSIHVTKKKKKIGQRRGKTLKLNRPRVK